MCGDNRAAGATGGQGRAAGPTRAERDAFLATLAATCNVRASAARAGVSPDRLYRLRDRDARFRAGWAEALEAGYQLLETRLVGHALAGGGPVLTDDDAEQTGPIDVELAKWLLAMRQSRLTGSREGGGTGRATAEETNAAILRKLKAMSRSRGASS